MEVMPLTVHMQNRKPKYGDILKPANGTRQREQWTRSNDDEGNGRRCVPSTPTNPGRPLSKAN